VQAALEAKKYPHQKPDSTFFEVPNRIRGINRKTDRRKAPKKIALTSGGERGKWQPSRTLLPGILATK